MRRWQIQEHLMCQRGVPCLALLVSLCPLVVLAERPLEHRGSLETGHGQTARRPRTPLKSIQVNSATSLVSLSGRLGNKEPVDETDAVPDNDTVQSASSDEVPGNDAVQSASSDKVKDGNPTADSDENLVASDSERVLKLLPAMNEWMATLAAVFKQNDGTHCPIVEGSGGMTYGCGWQPKDRTNMTIKDHQQPACSCHFSFVGLESCYKPDVDELFKYIEGNDVAKAERMARAYLAGWCYVPIYVWGTIFFLLFGLCCCGGWSVKVRMDGIMNESSDLIDPRLKGSTHDPMQMEYKQ